MANIINYTDFPSMNFTNHSAAGGAMIAPFMVKTWEWWFMQIMTPFIVLGGIVGNCLSFAVMKSHSLRKKSYSHFLCALAVFDSIALITRQIYLIDDLLAHYGKVGIFVHFGHVACKTYNFLEHMCILMSSWLVVVMAAERVVAVCIPFKRTKLRTQTGALATIASLFVVLSYTQVFRFIVYGSSETGCTSFEEYRQLYIHLHVYLYQFALAFVVPFLLVFVFNMTVLYQIYRVRKAASNDTRSRVIARTQKTTCMLLAISFTFIITMLPNVVISLIINALLYTSQSPKDVFMMFLRLKPVSDFLTVIAYVNYGINFVIYIMSGQSFRFEVKKFFHLERMSTINGTRTREEIIKLQ